MMLRPKARIAVDAMGGDFGPGVIVEGSLDAARGRDIHLLLVGDEQVLKEELARRKTSGVSVEIVHASEVVTMHDKPSEILRRKKDSSIHTACRLVKEGRADGVVSAGNSGATLACGMFIIGRVPGIDRPAFASIMPTEKRPMILLDVGANVDVKPDNLFQFGIMADVLARRVLGYERPRVGLLSIGEEEGKGNTLVKEAYEYFRGSTMNFVGNVEGRDIFTGEIDVVVCDGFVGNVALKLSEGLASSMGRLLKGELTKGILSRLGTVLSIGALRRFRRLVDYSEYGGAPLIGLKGIVIVCHGSSNANAIKSSVDMAATFVISKANEHLMSELSENKELTRYIRPGGAMPQSA